MWQKLKDMFSGGSSASLVVIEPVKFEDGLLFFKTKETLKLKGMKIAGPCKKGYLDFVIDVLSFDEEAGLYRAKLENETFSLDAMQVERPKGFRLDVEIPVTSPEVKGDIRTEDLALTGCRLRLKQKLDRGSHITVKLHWKNSLFQDLELRSEVKWCGATRKGLYHCAVRFFMINKAEKTIIKRFIQNRAALG